MLDCGRTAGVWPCRCCAGSGSGGARDVVALGAPEVEVDRHCDAGEDADRRVADRESCASLGQRRDPEDGTDDQVEHSDGDLLELAPRGVVAATMVDMVIGAAV